MSLLDMLAQGVTPPKFLSPQELQQQQYKNELLRMKMQEAQQQMQGRNALRQIFSDPASLDPDTGMPNKNALARVYAADPDTGMTLSNNINELARQREAHQTNLVHQGLYKLQINERQSGELTRVAIGLQDMYDRLVAQGIPRDEAISQVSQERSRQIEGMAESGLFSPNQIERFRGPFNPANNKAFIAATPQYKDYLAAQKTGDEPPRTRNRIEGEQEVQEEWDPNTRSYKEIGRGPRFAKSVAAAPTPGGAAESWDKWTDEQKNAFADQAAKDRSLLTGIGRGAQGAKLLLDINQRITQRQIESGQPGAADRRAQFRADSNSLNKLTMQHDAITTFENTAIQNGKVLVDLAKKVDATGVPLIERWIRAGRKEVAGDPDISEFNAQIQLFGNEAAKILTNPSLSGVLTNEARQEVASFLPKSANAKQIERVVQRLEADFKNRENSVTQQMDAIRGRMEKGYESASGKPAARAGSGASGSQPSATNAKGWKLYVDKNGAKAYVSPDGKQFEEVK